MSFEQSNVHHPSPASNDSNHNKGFWEWTARIQAGKCDLGSSYNVIIFLGDVPSDPDEWLNCPQIVGKHSVLVSGHTYRRRGTSDSDTTEGFVHLNNAIAKRSGLNSLDPKDVVPYLEKTLEWRVQKVDGSPAELNSLEVVVFATPMTYPPGGMFPVPGEPKRYSSITHGRQGGSKQS